MSERNQRQTAKMAGKKAAMTAGMTSGMTAGMTVADARSALSRAAEQRALPVSHFAWLKRQGLVGGDAKHPVVTAKGRQIMGARLAAKALADNANEPVLHLPDAMDRLANPRKGEAALVEPCDLAAARRFQSDLARAGLRQRITQSWSLASLDHHSSKGGRSAPNEPASMLDARERVRRACASIGPEFAGLLMDVCLYEKSLSRVESERRWPARSAKLAIALGLRSLARHYGLTSSTADGAA